MSSGYVFKNIHPISQCEYLITFNWINGDVQKGHVSCGYDSMNNHTNSQQNGLKSLNNDNDSNGIDINDTLQNLYVSSGIGLLNRQTLNS